MPGNIVSGIILLPKQNFEHNKRFLRALSAGIIHQFTSIIYPSHVCVEALVHAEETKGNRRSVYKG